MAAVTYGGSYTSAPVSGVNYIGWQGNGSLTIDQTGTSGGTVAITGGITEAIGGASGYPLATGTVTITGRRRGVYVQRQLPNLDVGVIIRHRKCVRLLRGHIRPDRHHIGRKRQLRWHRHDRRKRTTDGTTTTPCTWNARLDRCR